MTEKIEVTLSSGCIFCDIELPPDAYGNHVYKDMKVPCALLKPVEHLDFIVKVLRPVAISLQHPKADQR